MSETPPGDKPEIRYVNLYEAEAKIYTRRISGYFQRLRRYLSAPLIALFVLLPWLSYHGRPVVWLDIQHQQFNILHFSFWPQDFMLLAWLFIIAAFALFTVSALWGRVWCGFTCPQTVWTLLYIAVADAFEGDRNKRMKLDQQAWSFEKFARKAAKHLVWLLIALLTGLTFVGYFVPSPQLVMGLLPHLDAAGNMTTSLGWGPVFWVLLCSGMTYLNAGYLREQVCKYMCPYSRFQSVMYDKDTIYVQYDTARGETRGPRKPNDDFKAKGLGDCIDCSWCVQVCPVNIDIRDGTQFECINCGLCVDACDQVMDKMGYPKGLIRFTSETELSTGKLQVFRPRLIGYALAVLIMLGAFGYTVSERKPVSIDVLRDRGARMYRVDGDDIQNVYTLKINNMDQQDHTYDIAVKADEGDATEFRILHGHSVKVKTGEVLSVPLRVAVQAAALKGAKHEVEFVVTAQDNAAIVANEESIFVGPEHE